ncbi:hypothetical protein [Burkholderia contaminans]|uniref:hypothetical protein n=1 Tax=Burkholderia contaminans TaxID=488447 RepID=UPI00158D2661|nr:hypothetical protein [Burkholderia contaminans]
MAKEKYMDEFTRDEQERVAGSNSHWDIFVANEAGMPTKRTTWKKQEVVVVEDPNAGRQPSKLDMVPLGEYSDTVLPRWKIDIIQEQSKAERLVSSIDHNAEAPAKQSRSITQKI